MNKISEINDDFDKDMVNDNIDAINFVYLKASIKSSGKLKAN